MGRIASVYHMRQAVSILQSEKVNMPLRPKVELWTQNSVQAGSDCQGSQLTALLSGAASGGHGTVAFAS